MKDWHRITPINVMNMQRERETLSSRESKRWENKSRIERERIEERARERKGADDGHIQPHRRQPPALLFLLNGTKSFGGRKY